MVKSEPRSSESIDKTVVFSPVLSLTQQQVLTPPTNKNHGLVVSQVWCWWDTCPELSGVWRPLKQDSYCYYSWLSIRTWKSDTIAEDCDTGHEEATWALTRRFSPQWVVSTVPEVAIQAAGVKVINSLTVLQTTSYSNKWCSKMPLYNRDTGIM